MDETILCFASTVDGFLYLAPACVVMQSFFVLYSGDLC
jgi:hypothetical protein